MDLALLPAYRGQGIGSSLLDAILAEGQRAQKPVTIHVEKQNRALRLYERLGFERIADRDVVIAQPGPRLEGVVKQTASDIH